MFCIILREICYYFNKSIQSASIFYWFVSTNNILQSDCFKLHCLLSFIYGKHLLDNLVTRNREATYNYVVDWLIALYFNEELFSCNAVDFLTQINQPNFRNIILFLDASGLQFILINTDNICHLPELVLKLIRISWYLVIWGTKLVYGNKNFL